MRVLAFNILVIMLFGFDSGNSADLKIFVTSQLNGEINACQCGGNNQGGVATIAKMVNEKSDSGALTLLPGNILGYYQNPVKDSLLFSLAKRIKYDAIGLGWADFMEGADNIAAVRNSLGIAGINCNLEYDGRELGTPFRLVSKNGIRVGITGAVELAKLESPLLAGKLNGLTVYDPVDRVGTQLTLQENETDLFVILSDMTVDEENAIKQNYRGNKEILVITANGQRGRDTTRWDGGFYALNPGMRGRHGWLISINKSLRFCRFDYLPVSLKVGEDPEVATAVDIYRRVYEKPLADITMPSIPLKKNYNGENSGRDSLVFFYSPACQDCKSINENYLAALIRKGRTRVVYENITDPHCYGKLMDLQKKMNVITMDIPVALYRGMLYDGKDQILSLLAELK